MLRRNPYRLTVSGFLEFAILALYIVMTVILTLAVFAALGQYKLLDPSVIASLVVVEIPLTAFFYFLGSRKIWSPLSRMLALRMADGRSMNFPALRLCS